MYLLLELHYLEHSFVQAKHSFQRKFHVRKGQSDIEIRTLFKKFKQTGSVNDDHIGNVGKPCLSVRQSNAEVVQQVIQQQPQTSVFPVASCTGLRRMSIHRVRCLTLHMFPYKIQTHQPLSPNATNARYNIANAMLQLVDDSEFDVGNGSQMKHIFTSMALWSKQNSQIWRS